MTCPSGNNNSVIVVTARRACMVRIDSRERIRRARQFVATATTLASISSSCARAHALIYVLDDAIELATRNEINFD